MSKNSQGDKTLQRFSKNTTPAVTLEEKVYQQKLFHHKLKNDDIFCPGTTADVLGKGSGITVNNVVMPETFDIEGRTVPREEHRPSCSGVASQLKQGAGSSALVLSVKARRAQSFSLRVRNFILNAVSSAISTVSLLYTCSSMLKCYRPSTEHIQYYPKYCIQ